MEEHWLFPGSKEFQHTVGNSVYAVASEAASKKFIQEPSRYLPKAEVVTPPPRIMIIGPTGAGVATQCELLRKKYRIHTVELETAVRADYNRRVDELEAKRKVTREEEKRSSPMIDADGNPIKQEPQTQPEEPTPIDAEDMEEMHIAAMRTVMGPHLGACIVNGCFFSDLNNVDEEPEVLARKALSNLLIKARRATDIVIMMDVKTDVATKRKLDLEEIDRLAEEAKIAKREAKKERHRQHLEAGGDLDALSDDEDPEPDPQDKLASEIAVEDFKATKDKQEEALRELLATLKTARVPVVKISADRHINAVHKAITWHCRPFIEYRNSQLARHQSWKANPKRCQDLLVRGLARSSRYGDFSPMAPDVPLLSGKPEAFNYGVCFRNRVYYPRSEAEAEQFLQRPLEFVDLPEPSRISVHPAVAVIGAPLAGKTTLCAKLCEKLGAVSLSIANVVDFVLKQTLPCALSSQVASHLRSGSPVPDELLVEALQFRLSFHDCVTKGWVLDDFPATVQQARLLTEKGVCPHSVFCVTLPEHLTFARSAWLISKHECDSGELHQQQIPLQRLRLQAYAATSTQVRAYYGLSFGNVKILDGSKSVWAVYDRAVEEVKTTISQKLLYYRLTAQGLAAPVDGLGFTPERITNSESFFRRYCPVSLTLGNEIVPCNNPRHTVEYKSKLYWFSSAENQKVFLEDPDSYLQVQLPASTPRLLSFADRQSSLFCQIEDYCPVALVDKKELVKCNGGFIVQYSGKYWNLQNKEACAKFMRRPTRYTQRAKLPNKKPPQKGAQGNNALLAALQKGQSLEIADMLSYLQVSVAEAISTSLVEGGHRRLMYPGKSGKQSALLFLANYLRAHNPLNTQLYRDECQGVLDRFLDDCELPAELSAYVSRRHEAQARESAKEQGSTASDGASLAEASEELPGLEPPKPWTFEDERRYEDMCHRFDELFKKKS